MFKIKPEYRQRFDQAKAAVEGCGLSLAQFVDLVHAQDIVADSADLKASNGTSPITSHAMYLEVMTDMYADTGDVETSLSDIRRALDYLDLV